MKMNLLFASTIVLQSFLTVLGYNRRGVGGNGNTAALCDDHKSTAYVKFGRWGGSTTSSNNYNDDNDFGSYNHDPFCQLDLTDWTTSSSSSSSSRRATTRRSSSDSTKNNKSHVIRMASTKTKKRRSKSSSVEGESSRVISNDEIMIGISQPIIPDTVWESLTGDEFENTNVIDALAESALTMTTNHERNNWVSWRDPLPNDIDITLESGDIVVTTGKTLRTGFGSDVPWIKSMSIIPMSVDEITNLMMDSSRVKAYNSLSLGRTDARVIPSPDGQLTKIVRNVVQLPVTNKKVESVTLLHCRKLDNGSHLLVSRAVGGTKYATPNEKMGKSYILLGANLFEPTNDPDECRMTAITNVFSPGVPTFAAAKVGVKSAKDFVKDIRAMCVPAGGAK